MAWNLIGIISLIVITYIINNLTLTYGFNNLTYKLDIEKKTAEIGEEIEISSIIENKKPLAVSFLKVSESFPRYFNVRRNMYSLFIMPYQRVKRTYKVFVEKRGLYLIEDVALELGDFIGFDTNKIAIKIEEEVIIYPKKIDIKENLIPIGSFTGDISVKRWIIDDPLMTIGIREYTGNEPERFIHWPSSLRHASLMVKNFDFTSDNSVLILLNVETMKPSWKAVEEDLIEKVISLARGVMEEFEDAKIPYGFACNEYNSRSDFGRNYFYQPGLGINHLDNLLQVLSRITYQMPSSFKNTLRDIRERRGNYSTVVVITPRILEDYIEPLNNLSKSVNKAIVISTEEEYLSHLNNNIMKYRSE